MSVARESRVFARFLRGLPSYLKNTVSLREAREILARRMEEREENFLRFAGAAIFGNDGSPYRPLLDMAGCEQGDLRRMVLTEGLESTLRTLRAEGVYVTFEEFKGREPMVRRGRTIDVRPGDFDNPLIGRFFETESGGSTGAASRSKFDLEFLEELAPSVLVARHAHGTLGMPTLVWHGVFPDHTGSVSILLAARGGESTEKWYSPMTAVNMGELPFRFRAATRAMLLAARFAGVPLPKPVPLGLNDAAVIARWAADALSRRGTCLIRTVVSRALRVCQAARAEGLDLTGAVFMAGGEPPTPAKISRIEERGARFVPTYWFTEAGLVGWGCANPSHENDIHFFKDTLAMIPWEKTVSPSSITVNAFNFTSLMPSSPKVLLNVESDDYGLIEERSCGCELEACGFSEHLGNIRSYRKLSGEGVTLVGSGMVRVLEEVLPARFGGGPLSYQLQEEEDGQGFTRLILAVSPSLRIGREQDVIDTVMEEIAKEGPGSELVPLLWRQAETLKVVRREPEWTGRGKMMPLHLQGRGTTGATGKGGEE